MRSINQIGKKAVCSICATLALWTIGAHAGRLPPDPDNAALLYYQAFLLRPEPDAVAEELIYGIRIEEIDKILRGGRADKFEPDPEADELFHELEERLNNRGFEPNENIRGTELVTDLDQMLYNELRERRERDEKIRAVDANEEIREYLRSCRNPIAVAQAASEISECDWGIQYSQGFSYLLPQLVEIRNLGIILRAAALLLAADGDYRAAFERCLMARRFAGHVGDDANLLYTMSKVIDRNALECIQLLLGYMKADVDTLTWLRNQLGIEKGAPTSPARALKIDFELALQTLRMNTGILERAHQAMRIKDEIKALVKGRPAQNDGTPKEVRNLTDEELVALAGEPYANFLNSALRTMDSDMPYAEKYAELHSLTDQLEEEFGSSPVAAIRMMAHPEKLLTFSVVLALSGQALGLYNLQVRDTAHFNALKSAIGIYLVKAKTGQLPDTLPDYLPKDPYSGKDFEYKITKEGFVLRCRVKPVDERKVRQFEFKVQK